MIATHEVDWTREASIFCEEEFPKLVGALGLYCGDSLLSEELAQEALAIAWQRWPQVREASNRSAWVHRVAFNLNKSHFRRKRAERRAAARLRSAQVPHHASSDHALSMTVRDALRALPKKQRMAIVLHFYVDLTLVGVGFAMDVPEGTAKSLVRRGLLRLEKALEHGETNRLEFKGVNHVA